MDITAWVGIGVTVFVECVIFAAAIVRIYVHFSVKMSELGLRVSIVEKSDAEYKEFIREVRNDISEIKQELQNKQNRP